MDKKWTGVRHGGIKAAALKDEVLGGRRRSLDTAAQGNHSPAAALKDEVLAGVVDHLTRPRKEITRLLLHFFLSSRPRRSTRGGYTTADREMPAEAIQRPKLATRCAK